MSLPVVKVVGGKRALLPDIINRMPSRYGAVHEVFAGGLALTLALKPEKAYAIDINTELVNVHNVVRDNVEWLISELDMLETYHQILPRLEDKAQHYYQVRDTYNSDSFCLMSPAARAAVYLFCNSSSFNGVYRENSLGIYNVPHGKRMTPPILQADKLRKASTSMVSITVESGDFSRVLETVSPGDFVLLDSPYHGTFNSYNRQKFDWSEHLRVHQVCKCLSGMGVYWMLTNSDTPEMRDLYAAYHIEEVLAPRKVSGKASGRGNISELIVTNYPRSFYKGETV